MFSRFSFGLLVQSRLVDSTPNARLFSAHRHELTVLCDVDMDSFKSALRDVCRVALESSIDTVSDSASVLLSLFHVSLSFWSTFATCIQHCTRHDSEITPAQIRGLGLIISRSLHSRDWILSDLCMK